MAVVSTRVERNLVTLSSHDLVNPGCKIGIFFEILHKHSNRRAYDEILMMLSLNGMIYSLVENGVPDSKGRQEYRFRWVRDISPQLEHIIENTTRKCL